MTFEQNHKRNINTLIQLGFSPNQAKVYLALTKMGKESSAKEIWKHSGVAREEVYRKLRELEELGAIERILTKPYKFRASSLENVANAFLHKKAEKLSELQMEMSNLLEI